MTRRTFRAWKCRQGVHRFRTTGDLRTVYTCKDCGADIGALYRFFASKVNELLELSPKAPFMIDAQDIGRWTDGRDFFGDPQQPIPYRVLADPPQPV